MTGEKVNSSNRLEELGKTSRSLLRQNSKHEP